MRSCPGDTPTGPPSLTLADVDYCVMHSPFVKMVRKGFARIFYQDHLRADIRQSARQVMLGWALTVRCCKKSGTLGCYDQGSSHRRAGNAARMLPSGLMPRRRDSCSTQITAYRNAADSAAGILSSLAHRL